MNDTGKRRDDCPLKLEVCYPSCFWWREGYQCAFEVEKQSRKQLEDIKMLRQASRTVRFPEK